MKAVTVAAALLAAAAPTAGASAAAVPASGYARTGEPLLFGAVGYTRAMVLDHERSLGQRMPGVRVYRLWGEDLFTPDDLWARDTGHTVFLSVKAEQTEGAHLSWRAIADARPGSELHREMVRQARQLKSYGAPLVFVFNHEPEAARDDPKGGPDDFIAAWRKVVAVHRAAGVSNARYVWTATGTGFLRPAGHDRDARRFYPGDAWVDGIGTDTYNWGQCRSPREKWRTMAQIVEGHRAFGAEHPSEELMILEWGSTEDPADPNAKAEWIRTATELFTNAAYDQYTVILQWGLKVNATSPCRFTYASSPQAEQAWRSMGLHPAYSATGLS